MTSADAAHRRSGAVARGWRNFRRWRRGRPFWGGLFTLLAALEIFGSTQLSLGSFQLKIGLEGFLSYVIPVVLGLCGLLTWLTPQQRIFYGVIGTVVALYSLIGVNLGGFFLGMLLGIVGGSLTVAWAPIQPLPPAEPSPGPGGEPAEAEAGPAAGPDPAAEPGIPEATVDDLFTGPLTDVLPPPVNPLAEPAQPARPSPGAHRYAEAADDPQDTQHIPAQRGDEEQAPQESPPPDPGTGPGPSPRLYVITLVPLLVTALVVAGVRGGTPARAEPASPYPSACPHGTKPASAKPQRPAPSSSSKPTASRPAKATSRPAPPPKPTASPSPSTSSPAPSASPSASSTPGPGLIGGILNGIGDLLGVGDDDTPSPSASAPEGSPTPTGSRTPDGGTATTRAPQPAATPSTARPAKSPSTKPGPAAPKPTSSADCVVVDPKEHAAAGVPTVQKVPDQMLGSKLTLEGFAFDGVTELNTVDGSIRVLQFSMSEAVTDDFELRVPGPADNTTSLTSSALTVRQADGGEPVKFYCTEFTGTLAVPIPVPIPLTFTPDFPPPLTFPHMVFTGIDIQLVFVDTDVLEAPNLTTKILS